ncbi:alpha-2-macroglobulin family protein [Costertonia aggregata]|uniref:Alpha-2-macroglobulin n=1 Tax=Costertonia aggregata TaxID=343403 RepID=A0A7H9ARA3_9FLAO|nr:MG2 domain-containing protein [Costertonia aggregata]QLG46021.1 alpha-2-macroglobulin [Costertonia aggregata]
MKKLFTLFTIILFSQMAHSQNNESYKALWEKVQEFEQQALTKSALNVVTTISQKAKREKNSAQIVKALLYTSKYALTLEEDAQLNIVNRFKEEIKKADFPTKNILESYLANLYWQFFQQNRYQFYDRTKTDVKIDSVDFRTWDLTTLFQEISIHFEESLKNEKGLQKVPVSQFDEILNQQKGSDKYRPTLFDLLAHTALQFYKTNENSITRPADTFEINDTEILCEAETFAKLKISTDDKTSLQAKALQLYQKLVQFHTSNNTSEALLKVDIERLKFIYQNATFENKDAQYLEVLQNAASGSTTSIESVLYQCEIATLYHQQANTYQPKVNEEHRWKNKQALELCEQIISTAPKSRGAEKCKVLKSQILSKSLQLTSEKHIPINNPARLLVNYKNHNELKFTARTISPNQLKKLIDLYKKEEQLAFIQKLTVAKAWESKVKNEYDYQNHSTEVILPGLPNGQYILLVEPKVNGEVENNDKTFGFATVQVTNMALAQTQTPRNHQFQVIDRMNGKPVAGANLRFSYNLNYDGPIRNKAFTSDKMGIVNVPLSDKYWNNVNIQITHKDDTAYFGEYYINKKYSGRNGVNPYKGFLFTDRSIYRPGQPLYFKGIVLKSDESGSGVLTNTMVDVSLKDVNYQEVAKMQLKSNEYGSFSGEFILPGNGLTGNFTIEAKSSKPALATATRFLVEEYKRPKFETYFEPVSETYKVNDSVTVNGKAKAYAGSNITDAKVSYRVKRSVYFPRWHYWYNPYYYSTPKEIAHGETLTDASGNYKIDFKAIPDSGTNRKNLPTFQYEITADVIDINGETHSATTYVTVGYHALTANINVANTLDKEKKDIKIGVTTTNLNGQPVPANGTLKIYKLLAPDYVLRQRPWSAPDYPGFTKKRFKELFPHDAFENEHDSSNWEKGKMVWESTFDTGKSTTVSLGDIKKWASGKYVIELETKDKFGQPVKDVAQTALYAENDTKLADNQLFEIKTDEQNYAIGDKVKVTLLSNVENLHVSVFIEKDRKVIDTKLVVLNKDSKSFSVPVTKDDLGGFAITYNFSAYNAYQSGNLSISVPYPNTDLQIETVTFRDKLQPGTDETWSFKVKGAKGDKVAAEILASMYDASLDQFRRHYWGFNPLAKPTYYSNRYSNAHQSFGSSGFIMYNSYDNNYSYTPQYFDSFNWFGFHFGYGGGYNNRMMKRKSASLSIMGHEAEYDAVEEIALEDTVAGAPAPPREEKSVLESNKPKDNKGNGDQKADFDDVKIRKNLQETAFFFPQLQTDNEGNVSFSFTTPEALTKWRLQLLAHTKSLESSVLNLNTVTQKELMVIPNAPRFLRQGDKITISTKIANLTDKMLSGKATLELFDALNNKSISSNILLNTAQEQNFKVDSLGNTQVSWQLEIPQGLQAVQYKVIAKAGDYSDGEQNFLPVLTNRMLVTETLPMWVKSNQTKTFVLDKLKNKTSNTLKNHRLTLEITSNPAWYAVQALPYLMEYPYECNEQTFSRYYANTLASHIANSNPRIQEVFDQWRNSDALLSNLEKNQELKSLLIQETPWLRDAQSETEQKKRIALLFDLDKMKNEQANALRKLERNQKSSGAWAWFNGGRDNRYITQHIITGLGHLKHLSVTADADNMQMIQKAIRYLDNEFIDEYNRMKRYASNINDDHLSRNQMHYMYMRSFFKNIKTSKKVDDIMVYYKGQAQKYWTNKNLYSKGMLSLVLYRMDDTGTSNKILRSLRENSITSDELGMYWKENTNSWHWYQAPVETQALLIEAFGEIENDEETIDNLKIWLLKNKQTNQWKTTKATTEAVYALLLQGSDWLSVTDAVDVLLGNKRIEPSKLENVRVETGTGYYKTAWNGREIEPKMGEVQISKKGKGIAWGTLYWQYFEDLDKITKAETPLELKKKLFLKKNTDKGEEISEITQETNLKVGDLVRVRIELRADRPMEFVHMKDMRAAGFEPINVISTYKWQDGLGYYESTKDASTNFFFDYLPKGVYVFEYDIRVNNAGNFSNGITSIQSMYAPEFSSHSEGVRVSVK